MNNYFSRLPSTWALWEAHVLRLNEFIYSEHLKMWSLVSHRNMIGVLWLWPLTFLYWLSLTEQLIELLTYTDVDLFQSINTTLIPLCTMHLHNALILMQGRLMLLCTSLSNLDSVSQHKVHCFAFVVSVVATPAITATPHPNPQALLFSLWEHTGTQMVKPTLVMSGKGGRCSRWHRGHRQSAYTHTYIHREREIMVQKQRGAEGVGGSLRPVPPEHCALHTVYTMGAVDLVSVTKAWA